MASSRAKISSSSWEAAAAGSNLASLLAGALLISQFAPRALAHDRITTKVTWDREIAPIVQARCAGCHAAGGRSTIVLTTYDEARPWAAAIKEEVLTRRMPKWNAARGFGDFANDPSLSPFEMALIAAWVDGGAPQRDTGRDATTVQPASASLPDPGINRQPARVATLACKEQPLSGRLLAVTPRLERGGTLRVAARLPNGAHEIIVWIRDYDPAYSPTYWLRRPLALPQGSRLLVESDGVCTIEATLAR